jgi:hypothetical protein
MEYLQTELKPTKMSCREFSQATKVILSDNRQYLKRSMSLHSPELPFDDTVNTMVSDKKSNLIIGTEKGKVLVFNIARNKIVGEFKADKWIYSLFTSFNTVFASGYQRTIEQFSLSSFKSIWKIQASPDRENYGPRGVILSDVDKLSKVIANVGSTQFKIFNSRTRKVLKTFSVPLHLLGGVVRPDGRKPVVINYVYFPRTTVMAIIAKDDPFVYIYDFMQRQLLTRVKLYSKEDLGTKTFLKNSVMMQSEGHLFVYLQFGRNNPDTTNNKVKTILYIVKVCPDELGKGQHTASYLMHTELSKLET